MNLNFNGVISFYVYRPEMHLGKQLNLDVKCCFSIGRDPQRRPPRDQGETGVASASHAASLLSSNPITAPGSSAPRPRVTQKSPLCNRLLYIYEPLKTEM